MGIKIFWLRANSVKVDILLVNREKFQIFSKKKSCETHRTLRKSLFSYFLTAFLAAALVVVAFLAVSALASFLTSFLAVALVAFLAEV